mgnify:CR=1 FL=1
MAFYTRARAHELRAECYCKMWRAVWALLLKIGRQL